MIGTMEAFNDQQKKDLKILIRFIALYCRSKHGNGLQDKSSLVLPADLDNVVKAEVHLCSDCMALVGYAMDKRRKCPLQPKPSCKKCPIHCYSKANRDKIRDVMAFSGKRMILRGRLDLLWHYLT